MPGMLPSAQGLTNMMTESEEVYMIEEQTRDIMNNRATALPRMYNTRDVEAFRQWLNESKRR